MAQLSKAQNITPDVSPAQRVWQILNPIGDPLIHIRIESPAILILGDADTEALDGMTADSDRPSRVRVPRLWSRTVRPVVWFLKIFVMPITGTTMVLYGLLLYLLKDAELLEAQRHAAEPESPIAEETPVIEDGISFSTFSMSCSPTPSSMIASRSSRPR